MQPPMPSPSPSPAVPTRTHTVCTVRRVTTVPINRLFAPPPPLPLASSSLVQSQRCESSAPDSCNAAPSVTSHANGRGLDPSDDATTTANAPSQLQTLSLHARMQEEKQDSLAADPQRFRRNLAAMDLHRRRPDLTTTTTTTCCYAVPLWRRSFIPGGPTPCSRLGSPALGYTSQGPRSWEWQYDQTRPS